MTGKSVVSNTTTNVKLSSPVHSTQPIKTEPTSVAEFIADIKNPEMNFIKQETTAGTLDGSLANKENMFNFPFRDQTNKSAENNDVFSADNFNLHKFEQVSKKLLQHTTDSSSRPWKPYQRRKRYLDHNRSYSASHTPRRKSIVGHNNQDCSTEDLTGIMESAISNEDQDNSKPLLMANSAVSLLSLSLNEEMLRAESTNENDRDRKKSGGSDGSSSHAPAVGSTHVRKHSLGSCLENEFTGGSSTEDTELENSVKKNSDYDEGSSSGDKTVRCNTPADPQPLAKEDFDSTLIAAPSNGELEGKDLDVFETSEIQQQPAQVDEGKSKQRKKKSLTSWLLSSQKE